MIRFALLSLVFTLVCVGTGYSMFGEPEWFVGLFLGAAAAAAWWFERRVGAVLGVAALVLLLLAVAGFGDSLKAGGRAVFNGMALGVILGLGLCAAVRWRPVKARLLQRAELEEEYWLLRLLGRKPD